MLFLAKLLDSIFYNIIDTIYVIASLGYILFTSILIPFLVLMANFLILKNFGGLWALLSLTSLGLIFGIAMFKHNMKLRSGVHLRSINTHLLDRANIDKHMIAIHQKENEGQN